MSLEESGLALVKGFNVGLEQTFRDHKKFRTSSRIAEWGRGGGEEGG